MQLEGSCHCGAVKFRVRSRYPVPYQRCYCSICRKTQGGGGWAVNLGADHATLKVTGRRHIRVYHAKLRQPGLARAPRSPAERHFCGACGSALWLYDQRWPEQIHPFASAIDTVLPVPPRHTHLMLAFKAPWVEVQARRGDRQHQHYPEESLAAWHERTGLVDDD